MRSLSRRRGGVSFISLLSLALCTRCSSRYGAPCLIRGHEQVLLIGDKQKPKDKRQQPRIIAADKLLARSQHANHWPYCATLHVALPISPFTPPFPSLHPKYLYTVIHSTHEITGTTPRNGRS
ncbi:hypothetical protein HDV57DRAFT_481046 [Trichoderma longibrachiatum]